MYKWDVVIMFLRYKKAGLQWEGMKQQSICGLDLEHEL